MTPDDPEAAALDLIVSMPAELFDDDELTAVVTDYCALLHAEGALAGLSWHDARHVAAAVSCDLCTSTEPASILRNRAFKVSAGGDGMAWNNRRGVSRALRLAASVLEL